MKKYYVVWESHKIISGKISSPGWFNGKLELPEPELFPMRSELKCLRCSTRLRRTRLRSYRRIRCRFGRIRIVSSDEMHDKSDSTPPASPASGIPIKARIRCI